jgi:hypothetical protein
VTFRELTRLMKAFSDKTPEDRARDDLAALRKNLSAREGKYIRNMNRYNNNGVRREDLWTPYVWPQAYVLPAQNTDGVQTQFNLIKSCVDTLTSKISQAAVRPYFNALNGDYDTTRACKALQQHFDFWLDEQHAYPKSIMAFRDAAVFDLGVMQVDAEHQSIDRVPPWEYFLDPAEYMHGAITRAMRWRKHFPLAKLTESIANKVLKDMLAKDPHCADEYAEYYDLYGGYKWEFFGREQVRDPIKLDYAQYGGLYRRPFIEIYYTKPVKGFFSTSLADDLYPIQREVDEIVRRLDNATRNMPLGLGFVPKGSGLKATQIGNAITLYDVLTGGENGQVQFITPQPVSQEWIQLLNMYMDKGYELSGISKMSAQSKKPADIESGKALETLEDVESDRFNVQLQQFTHFLVDISRLCIDVFPAGKTILPPKILRDDVTWGDARSQRDKYSIQFSAASVLSKDPDKKMQQVQAMINGGFIDHSMASHFMQIPDLEGVFTIMSANYDAAQKVIQECIEGNEYEFFETVDLQVLKSEIVKRINMLVVSEDDMKYVKRLVALLERVDDMQKQVAEVNKPAPIQPPPEPLKDKSMDSGQVTGLMAVVEKVNMGTISIEQGSAIIASAYPQVDPNSISMMVKPKPVLSGQGGIPGASPPGGGNVPAPAQAGNPTAAGVTNA